MPTGLKNTIYDHLTIKLKKIDLDVNKENFIKKINSS
jgi:hypothetical protein